MWACLPYTHASDPTLRTLPYATKARVANSSLRELPTADGDPMLITSRLKAWPRAKIAACAKHLANLGLGLLPDQVCVVRLVCPLHAWS